MIKTLRIASFIIGLGALIFTARSFWHAAGFFAENGLDLNILWRVVFQWLLTWYDLIQAIFLPGVSLQLSLTGYLYILVLVSAPVCAAILSQSLAIGRLKWPALVLAFPFLLLALVILDTRWFHRRRVERLNAKAATLEDGKEYDLLFLHSKGFVRARGMGQSITRIYGEIENLVAKKLRIVIEPGTYFVARGNCQNMVTRKEYSVTLYPTSTERVTIDAACINANLPIPSEKDRFYGVRRVSDDLARFLQASRRADPMTVQAGVWALTDNYSGSDVKNHLILQDQYGNRRQAVTDRNIEEARRILNELGIRSRL